MGAPEGKPQVFVNRSGNGMGIPTYRRLQRAGIPFAAGIIHKRMMWIMKSRKRWRTEVICEEPFENDYRRKSGESAESHGSLWRSDPCCVDKFGPMQSKETENLWKKRGRMEN